MANGPLQILIVGEDADRAAVLERGLRASSSSAGTMPVLHRVPKLADLLLHAAKLEPDVVVVDLGEPGGERLEQLLAVVRAVKRPIAVFVDRSDADGAQRAVEAGVSAYVVDGLREERVRAIVDVAISRHRAISRLEAELARARSALDDRKIVERAKALLMQREGVAEDEAYRLLRSAAMNQNRRMADLARAIVAASSLLGDSKPKKRKPDDA